MTSFWPTRRPKRRVSRVVLDSSAVLALLRGETGADRVESARTHALISTVNVCEVLTRQYELGWDQVSAQAAFEALELDVSAFPMSDAVSAAALRAATRHAGLSLGDRACLALALRESAPVMTADRDWLKVDVGVEVLLIR